MKKIFSLLTVGMIALAGTASARQPTVILNTPAAFEVRIDNQVYATQAGTVRINNLTPGTHTINVYQVTAGGILGIGKKRTLVSSRQFELNNNDVSINIDQNGYPQIYNNGSNGDGTYSDGNDGRRYGKSEGKGRGHKYGHYKNKKQKKQKACHHEHENQQ